jgi:S-adenosylmethionine decarboxylase
VLAEWTRLVDVPKETRSTLLGEEWIVDALACDSGKLRALDVVRGALDEIVIAMDLHVVGEPLFHKFAGEGGVTGLYLLSESHLACHTYPEHKSLTLNLYSCRERPSFDFAAHLAKAVGAATVRVVRVPRGASDRGELEPAS